MPSSASSRAARHVTAALVTSIVLLFAFTGSASADYNPCSSGTTTWTASGSGNWDTSADWSNGQPSSSCDAVISSAVTVTLSTTTQSFGSDNGTGVKGLSLSGGATLVVEGEASDNQGNWLTFTALGIGTDGLTIGSGSTLDLEATANSATTPTGGEASGGSVYVQMETGSSVPFTNAGTINASSSDSTYGEYFQFGADLVNTGTINASSGTLNLEGTSPMLVSNTGAFNVASGAAVAMDAGDGSSFTNNGAYANQGATSLSGSMYWIQSGSETGNPVQLTSGETLEDLAGAGSFEVTNCTTDTLIGTVPADQTITVMGGCSGTTLNLGSGSNTPPVVNDGTLVLDAPAGGSDGIVQGSELDNHGTLDSTVGGAQLANQLLVPLVNESGATVNLTGGELEQTTGSATTNAGTVNIAPGATWLVQGGSFTNSGTLAPQIAGPTSVGTVNLTVGSKFNAGGTLAPALVSGYQPAVGTEFPIITMNGGSPSGTFGSVTGGFSADYSKETASPPYVGVIYGGSAGAGNPGTGNPGTGTTAPNVVKVSGGSGKVTFTVSCSASAKSCTSYTATSTVTEHLKGKKILAVTAKAKKSKAKTKVVTVGSSTGSLKPGKSAKVTLKLNRAGMALLKKFDKLKVRVVIKSGDKVISSATVIITEPKAKSKKKTKK